MADDQTIPGRSAPHGTTNAPTPTAIIGAGIAGLTAAIALARTAGRRSTVFDAVATPTPVGAGIQLGSNATAILRDLGLLPALLEAGAVQPRAIVVQDGHTGRVLSRLPLGPTMVERFGAPYLCVHRSDLYGVLQRASEAHPDIDLRYGATASAALDAVPADVRAEQDGPVADPPISVNGAPLAADLTVIADGAWSGLRTLVAPHANLAFTRQVATRALLPMTAVQEALLPSIFANNVAVWMLPHAHVVHYPVAGGQQLNLVIITRPRLNDAAHEALRGGWRGAIQDFDLTRVFGGAAPALQRLVRLTLETDTATLGSWALHTLEGAATPVRGGRVLIGDAWHPILPFLAQGAAMAIEDACALARIVAADRPLEDFAAVRQERVAQVARASERNGEIYHLRGAGAIARNFALRTVPAQMLMARYDWLYGARVT